MGTFTVLDAAELAALAHTFDLGALTSHRAIAAGTINSNFALVTDRGRYFLRVNEGKAEADVAWEARTVGALAARGVSTPGPVVARDGRPYAAVRGKWASVFPWTAGRHLAAHEVTERHAERLGRALAQLHVAGEASGIELRRSIYDHGHLVGRFERQIEPSVDPMLDQAKRVLRDELAAADAARDVRAAATHGLIHGDLFRDNVLWDDDAISALLDFEQASAGSLVYDLAVCINDWCWTEQSGPHGPTGEPRLELAAAMVRGYGAVRALTPADRAALPGELRAAAARFTITRITDVFLAEVHNPEKDFRAFLARVEAWRSSALRALSDLV